jgi:outer membrane biosynthesis protein TonB
LAADNIDEKAIELIKSHPNGVLQSDLWKDLGIDSRKCSRVIAKLEAEGKVKRTWETVKGTRTYRISYLPQKKEAPKKSYSFDMIMAEGNVAPCIGCTYECEPDYCPDLGNWIELLAKEEARKGETKGEEQPAEVPEPEEPPVVPKKVEAKKPVPEKPAEAKKVEAKKPAAKKSPAKKSKA